MANNNVNTIVSQFGKVYDPNAINNLAMKLRLQPLTVDQIKSMTDDQIKNYLMQGKASNKDTTKTIKEISRTLRTNAKAMTSENLQQAKLMHNTVRQGLAELGTLGAQLIGTSAITKRKQAESAVDQNVSGGTDSSIGSSKSDPTVNYSASEFSFKRRKEE